MNSYASWSRRFQSLGGLVAASGLVSAPAAGEITIDLVTVGNPGNRADSLTGLGSVSYVYNLGATEVTNAQYAAFLNAKARSGLHGLYNVRMGESLGGILRTGTEGSFQYQVVDGRGNKPVNWVSFWDAARFVNWLHNGQGSGDTESGAYTLTTESILNNTVARNADWRWALPTEDEWYKAAYHQPGEQGGDADGWWRYTNRSNTLPTVADAHIFGSDPYDAANVGSYAANFYGAFDMGGNMWEWNEGLYNAPGVGNRTLRGGAFTYFDWSLGAEVSVLTDAFHENLDHGFRVVNIPAPGAMALIAAACALGARRRRR